MTTFRRFFMTPLITLAAIGIIHLTPGNTTLALPFSVFAIVSYFGGLRSNLVSALLISAYALYISPDLWRVAQIGLGAFGLAIGSGWVLRRLRLETLRRIQNDGAATTLDGNIGKIQDCRAMIREILKKHQLDAEAYNDIEAVLHELNNLEFATAGWRALGELKTQIEQGRK